MAMTNEQLRARVRALIASGDLPNEPPVVQNAAPGFGNFKAWFAMLDLRRA